MNPDLPSWPDALPLPYSGFSVRSVPDARRTTMDSGKTRQRQRFGTPYHILSGTWGLTNAEKEYFDSFHFHKLDNGTSFFNMDCFVGGELRSLAVRIISGAASFTETGVLFWEGQLELETYDPVSMSELTFDFLQDAGILPDDALNAAALLVGNSDRYFEILNYELAYPTTDLPWD